MGDSNINLILGAKAQASKVVTGLRGQFETFKRDAQMGFGIGAGFSAFSLLSRGVRMATDYMADAVSMASDMWETQNKLDEVFDASAATMRAWATDSAQSMGLTQQAALEAGATFGNFLQALGEGEQSSADMSRTIVQLGADLASFNNIAGGAEEVLEALQGGLAGETKAVRRFGIDISDTAVTT